MALDVFHDHDFASSTTNPPRRTIASKVSRLIVKPANEHQEKAPINRNRVWQRPG